MLVRVLTGLIGLAVFFVVLFFDPIVFNVVIYLLTVGMLAEVYKATKPGIPLIIAGFVSAVMITAGSLLNVSFAAIIVSAMIYAVMCIALHGQKKYTEVLSSAFCTWYIVLFTGALCSVRRDFDIYGIIMVCLCAWMTDTAAFFSGKLFGKHKLIEHVSPKKTVEGAIGGVLFTALSSAVYAFILMRLNVIDSTIMNYTEFAFLGLFGSIMSQLGDLFASAIKRDCGIKDFGTIFPGHGGILDRFDSVVFIVPFIYGFMWYFNLMRL